LNGEGFRVVYVVSGDGDREAELHALAASLNLPTIFTGPLDADGIIAALAGADVAVHPSLREIFPNAVGEAMACARPVVAADAGGTAELIGESGAAGLLVPPGDPAALADALGSLFADPGRRAHIGAAARRRIEAEFPLTRMIDGYERVLKEVLGGTRS
jgi:glycosyltransferase involved in cell wall biosynthesis